MWCIQNFFGKLPIVVFGALRVKNERHVEWGR